jgi:hypothetical protein
MYAFRAIAYHNCEYSDSFGPWCNQWYSVVEGFPLSSVDGFDTWISSNKVELIRAVRHHYPGPLMDLWRAVEKTSKLDLRKVRKLMRIQGNYTPYEIRDLPGVIRVLDYFD